ncbi:MAG: hypothetical protein KDB74_05785 [Flavobacteriales bacterium]|nr:hypothetical protein [Flavobacteriales bacterium]
MKSVKPYFYFLLVFVLIIIGTFPESNWTYSVGLDYSIRWVFNFLFQSNSELGANIVFPHGPLGFLVYPLPGNIQFVYLIQSLNKGLFILAIYFIQESSISESKKWSITLLMSFLFLSILGFSHTMLLVILLSFYTGIHLNKKWFAYIGTLLTVLSIYVSAYQGVIAFTFFLSALLYEIFILKFKKQAIIKLVVFGFGLLLINILLFGELSYIPSYFIGLFNLIQDNSSAVAYYPQNNWLFLVLFFISLILLVLNNLKSKQSVLFLILSVLSIFAAWKHGMAREDTTHARGFMEFCLAVTVLFVFIQKNKIVNYILVFCSFLLLSANLVNVTNYWPTSYHFMRADNFINYIQSANAIEQQAVEQSAKNIKVNKLPDSLLQIIGNEFVDIYPWDYTIIKANNLNWKPRIVIQSYASYTSWLDQQNANHFESDSAPEYLIWMIEKVNLGINLGEYNSIDYRYILNDEPKTIIKLLEKYELVHVADQFYLYKKRKQAVNVESIVSDVSEAKLGEWIPIKYNNQGLYRVKLNFKRTFTQAVKSFLYKDEQYWVSLKLANNMIHNYRIVPKNAKDGIWINPYLFKRGELFQVKEIKITASNPEILNPNFTYSSEELTFSESNSIQSFFKAKLKSPKLQLIHSKLAFSQDKRVDSAYWIYNSVNNLNQEHIEVIQPGNYSSTFKYLEQDTIDGVFLIHANATIDWNCSFKNNEIVLVIEIKDNEKLLKYDVLFVDQQIVNSNGSNQVLLNTSINYSGSDLQVKSYIRNTSSHELKLSNYQVQIIEN